MREAFESEARSTGKDRLLITMAVPASLEYAGKVIEVFCLSKLCTLAKPHIFLFVFLAFNHSVIVC